MTELERYPYPGLQPFKREDADLFFGRDGCVNTMVDCLAATRFLAVLGASGSGKSSLVRTGLETSLRFGLHPAGTCWSIADFHPGGQPFENLASALRNQGPGSEGINADLLRRGPLSLVQWATNGNLKPECNLLLLVDQFEELFRYGDSKELEETEEFCALLLESASASEVSISVVITMRSEFFGACASIPKLADGIGKGLFLTPRMTRQECREAIEGPARVLGFKVEPALVNRTLNDLATFAPWERCEGIAQLELLSRQSDQLPLMQHVLNLLWARATEANGKLGTGQVVLRLKDYEEVGGLTGAIEKHGSEILNGLKDRGSYVPSIFCQLVEGSQVASALRRRCTLTELARVAGCSRGDLTTILAEFEKPSCKFVRKEFKARIDNVDEYIVDLSHESLIRQWPELGKWVRAEALDAKEWRRLVEAQERYSHTNRTGGLLTGDDFKSLERWWLERSPTPAWTQRYGGDFQKVENFLEESRKSTLKSGEESALVWSAGIILPIFRDLVDLLLSDAHVSLLGSSKLQAKLMESLERYASTKNEKLSGSDPAAKIRIEYRLGLSYEESGAADTALEKYSQAYLDGLSAIDCSGAADESRNRLKAEIIEAGAIYAWFLLDIGRDSDAGKVIDRLRGLAGAYDAESAPRELRVALARLENLLHKLFFDPNHLDDQHVSMALALLAPITAEDDAEMDVLSLQSVLYSNLVAPRHEEALDTAGELADRMARKSRSDTRAIRAVVTVLLSKARAAKTADKLDNAEHALLGTKTILDWLLTFFPDNYRSALLLAAVEGDLADLERDAEQRKIHTLRACDLFVKAFNGRTWFPSRFSEIRKTYGRLTGIELSPDEKKECYSQIIDALRPTLEVFPKARDFAFVAADASVRLSEELKAYPDKEREQEEYLSKAICWFDGSRRTGDSIPTTFDFDNFDYAKAFSLRISLYGALGRTEDMLADVKRVGELFQPVLKNVPWDLWLRRALLGCEETAGQALFRLGRYDEAYPHLEFASKWGFRLCSIRLAEMNREGLGTERDDQKSRELEDLAKRQLSTSFKIPMTNGEARSNEEMTIFEWPAEYPYMGIDDQVEYYKAMGFTIDEEIAMCFRAIHQLARESDLSFPALVYSILDKARDDKPMNRVDHLLPLEEVEGIPGIIATLEELGVLAANKTEPVGQSDSAASPEGSEADMAAARGQTEQVRKLIAAGASTPRIWLRPRVSDAANFLSFVEIDAPEFDRLAPRLLAFAPAMIVGADKMRLRRAPLSFFPNYWILAIEDPTTPGQNEQFALEGPDGKLTLMNWTNQPIYEIAQECQPNFDDVNVILYCRFFFHWVRGQQGRFIFTEPFDSISWTDAASDDDRKPVIDKLRNLRIQERLDDRVRLHGTVIFKNALFTTDVLIATRETDVLDAASGRLDHFYVGNTKLLNENLIFENLPVEVDLPAGIFG